MTNDPAMHYISFGKLDNGSSALGALILISIVFDVK